MNVNSTQRLTGLFSGLDTDALVTAMMSTEQSKVDLLFQSKTKAEWKLGFYTDFNNQLRMFRENFGSAIGSTSMLSRSTFFNNSSDLTQNKYLSVTTTSTAVAGRYSVQIDQLASAASMNGSRATALSGGLSSDNINKNSIASISSFRNGVFSGDEFSFSINGEDFTFESSATLKNVMDTVNKSSAGVTMSYSQATDTFKIVSNASGEYKGLSHPGDPPTEISFDWEKPVLEDYYDEEDYNDALDLYNEALAEYNAEYGDPYRAELAEYNKQLAAYNEDVNLTIDFSDYDGFLSHIGLNRVTEGTSAIVSINGGEARSFNSNSFTLDGVTFNLHAVTAPGETVDFNVTPDSTSAIDNIKSFVDTLNGIISSMSKSINGKRDYDYKPLTDAQRAELSEEEAAKWDEKAAAGILARDSYLTSFVNEVQKMLSDDFGGGRLKDIGITTSYVTGEGFKLQIDEEKLTKALDEDPEKIYNMFSSSKVKDQNDGFMVRINSLIETFISGTSGQAIQSLNNEINNLSKDIKEKENNMILKSESYYLQYAKLETALQQMQSQQDYVASLFGSG